MIRRAIIHINGQSGAGKTTLMEAAIGELRSESVLSVYAVRDDSLRRPRESAPKGDAHLKRYRDAGADHRVLYRFPLKKSGGIDEFFEAEAMSQYSSVVLIEGDSPVNYCELTAFVARPLPAGESLLVAGMRDNKSIRERELAEAEKLAENPADLLELFSRDFGGMFRSLVEMQPNLLDETRERLRRNLQELRSQPAPEPTPCLTLAESHRGIQDAGLVVVNIFDETERECAEALVRDVHRLRADKAVFEEVLGWRYHRTPVTALVAKLSDPNDAGRKKALARLKRAVAKGQEG